VKFVPQVDAVRTPATLAEVAGAMSRAYTAVRGHSPVSEDSYLIPTAQSAFETGQWKSMFNWNTGNVTTGNLSTDDWMYEYAGSLRFKSFPDLDAGSLDQMKVLQRMKALDAADAGDVPGFVDALRRGKYIGNDENAYRALANTIPQLLSKFHGVSPQPARAKSTSPWAILGGLTVIAAAVVVARRIK